MHNFQRAAVGQVHPKRLKWTRLIQFPDLIDRHSSWLLQPLYHFSPNCSPAFPLRAMPPFSGPLRLGTASSRGGSSTSAFSLAPSVAFSGFAMAALSERLIRCAS